MGRIRGQPNLTTEQKARIAGMVEAGMSHGRVASNDETDAMRASASHRIVRLSHRIGVSHAGPRIASSASEKPMRRIGIASISRCDARYFAGDADVIGRHCLNLPPESPDMRRDSGGVVVMYACESDSTPSHSGVQTRLRIAIRLPNSTALPFGTVLRNNGLDPLPHCHPLPLKPSQSSPSSLDYPSSLPPRLQQAKHFLQPGQHLASSASNPDFFDEQQYDRSPAPDQNFSIPPPNEAHRRTDEDSSHPLSRHHREIDDTLHPPKSPSIVPDDAPTLILTRCVRYGR
ncbi:hypothetical protein PGTUg99_024445 [Puccinia graminis f. sp. tritici]|uniref:HTH psq-type domain-containing protein n=1 Tax=Puccinia graminis f. sp. tritici TaxID=56615 RepID=A0A5B0QMC8_PUCGR|nr:hypothetical protein PGTUg99_024445 [Puccinia graminis f. sp. tritici]